MRLPWFISRNAPGTTPNFMLFTLHPGVTGGDVVVPVRITLLMVVTDPSTEIPENRSQAVYVTGTTRRLLNPEQQRMAYDRWSRKFTFQLEHIQQAPHAKIEGSRIYGVETGQTVRVRWLLESDGLEMGMPFSATPIIEPDYEQMGG